MSFISVTRNDDNVLLLDGHPGKIVAASTATLHTNDPDCDFRVYGVHATVSVARQDSGAAPGHRLLVTARKPTDCIVTLDTSPPAPSAWVRPPNSCVLHLSPFDAVPEPGYGVGREAVAAAVCLVIALSFGVTSL